MENTPAVKRIILYFALSLIAPASLLIFGFTVGGKISIFFWIAEFAVLLCIVVFVEKRYAQKSFRQSLSGKIALTGFIVMLTSLAYIMGNRSSATLVSEYEAAVTTYHRGSVGFKDPQGQEQRVDLNDPRNVLRDDTYDFSVRDTLHIHEMKGRFDAPFYLIVENCNLNEMQP